VGKFTFIIWVTLGLLCGQLLLLLVGYSFHAMVCIMSRGIYFNVWWITCSYFIWTSTYTICVFVFVKLLMHVFWVTFTAYGG